MINKSKPETSTNDALWFSISYNVESRRLKMISRNLKGCSGQATLTEDHGENSSQSPPHIDQQCCYGCGDSLDSIFCQRYTCKSCGKGAHYGYNCPPKVPIISNPKPCHNQNFEEFPQTLPSFHPTCYSGDENSFAYDSTPNVVNDSPNVFNLPSQPPTYSNEFYRNDAPYSYDCPPQVPFIYNRKPINDSMFELHGMFQAWFQQRKDQVVNLDYYSPKPLQCQKIPSYYDDDDDEESSTPLRDIIISELPLCIAITPILSTKEPKDSLIMGDEHLDTIPKKESDEFIKSSVENLVPNPGESKDERECDVPVCDNFTTFSNLLFDADDDFSSSDNESFSDEDIPKEIYSNPLFYEEIIFIKIDPRHFNAESDLIESWLNQDSSIISSSKIDSLLDEFADELIFLKSVPLGINEADCDPKEEIRLIDKLFNSLMEEIDLSLTLDDLMPPGIENDDYDSEGDILILEELLSNDSFSLPENESFHFDIPSSPCPPAKPPDDDEIEPNLGILIVKVVDQVWGDRVKLSDLKQALRGSQPMLILVVVLMNNFGVDAAIKLKEKHSKCLLLPVKILVLPDKIDAAGYYCWIVLLRRMMLLSQDKTIRIEEYFLMTDYSLWEVILNGDSPKPSVVVEDKHQLKFNSHKDAKTLLEAIEKRFGGNTETKKVQKTLLKQQFENFSGSSSEDLDLIHDRLQNLTHTPIWRNKTNLEEHSLDDLFNSLRIYEAEVMHSSSPRNLTQNIAFVSSSNTDSTTDSVSAATSVSAVCAQLHVSSHPNINSLSNAVIFSFFSSQSTSPQLDNEDLKQIDVDDLKEMDLRWQMAMLTMRARPCAKAYKQLHDQYDSQTVEIRKYKIDVLSYQAALESVESRLVVYKQNESILQDNIIVLTNKVAGRDHFISIATQKLKEAKTERDDLKLKFEKFQSSSKNIAELIASQTNNKHGLGYLPSEDVSANLSLSCSSDSVQPSGGYNVVPPQITGNFMPPKPDLVFNTAPIAVETAHSTFTVKLSSSKPTQDLSHTNRPSAPIIEEWVSDSEDESKTNDPKNAPSFAQPSKGMDHLIKDCTFHVKPKTQPTPRNNVHRGYDKQYASSTKKYHQKHRVPAVVFTKSKPVSVTAARPLSTTDPKIMAAKPRHAHSLHIKNNSVIRRHQTPSKFLKTSNSFLKVTAAHAKVDMFPLEEIPRVVRLQEKGKIKTDFKLPDESQVLLRVPRENNMYNVNLKDIIPYGDLTCLFAKATIDESNLWHRRLGHGIKREFSVPRTPQQNGITERKNRTLIKAARTMLADSLLPILFWAEAVNTACYIQNRVLVTKPQNKTLYELLHGRTPSIGFMRPFRCPVTIQNTLEPLGKFERKVDEGFLVGYSMHSKAFRVFNSRTRIIQETLHVNFLENTPNVVGTGPTWLFDIDSLTRTMNYQPVIAGNQTNPNTGFQEEFDVGKIGEEANQQYMLFPVWFTSSTNIQNKEGDTTFDGMENHFEDFSEDSSNDVSAASPIVPAAGQNCSNKADFNNLESSITVSPIPLIRIHNAHPISQIIGNLSSTTQTRSMARIIRDQGGISQVLNEDFHTCMFACFLSQEEPKRIHQALKDLSWIEAMQEELLQFKMIHGVPNGCKSAFLYGTIEEEVYKGDILLVQIYVDDIIFGATNKDLCKSFEKLMKDKFQMSSIRGTHILSGSSASTPIDTEKPLQKDPDGEDVDVHIYRSMIGSLMYLTSSRPNIMFAVCACARFQVTPKVSHLHAVKRIFRYLKGKPHLGLWYPKDSPFDLVAYSDSDYAGASLDKKSTTEGCQFLGSRLISWQCKKQTVIATSSTKAEYVAGASYYAQVLWIQNQMLDYGLQALVAKKKVVVTEAAIRDALHFDDADGVDCLPNEEIFNELARMGYENCRKFNFSKYIFEILVRNVDSSTKFYMYPRFITLIIQNQLGDLNTHSTKYLSPALTQKVFTNMRRVGKGCSGIETPLFEGMLIAKEPENQVNAEAEGDEEEHGTAAEEPVTTAVDDDQPISSPTPLTPPPQQPQDIPSTSHVQTPITQHQSPPTAQPQDLEILKLKTRVKKLERANKVKSMKLRRLRKVGTSQRIESSANTIMKDMSNQGRMIEESDKDEAAKVVNEEEETGEVRVNAVDAQVEGRQDEIYHIDMDHAAKVLIAAASGTVSATAVVPTSVTTATVTPAPVKVAVPATRRRRGVIIRDPEEESSTNTPVETKSNDKGKGILVEEPKPMKKKQQVEIDEAFARKLQEELDHFKEISYDDIRLIFEAKFNSNLKFLLKTKEQIEEEESRAITIINETPAQNAVKRRRLNEEAEDVEELKRHLEIMPDEDDDVFIEATPLARKVPVVDSRSYREELETLWNIVKERFSTSKPNNFSDEYLLSTLKTMFGRPDGQDNIILLVERRYPLMKFTLEQMLNVVRLQVEG
nr:hypothetical protein [Tanacetum cinerariifolium]